MTLVHGGPNRGAHVRLLQHLKGLCNRIAQGYSRSGAAPEMSSSNKFNADPAVEQRRDGASSQFYLNRAGQHAEAGNIIKIDERRSFWVLEGWWRTGVGAVYQSMYPPKVSEGELLSTARKSPGTKAD